MNEQRRYSSQICSKKSRINQMWRVMSALGGGKSLDDVRDLVLGGNPLLETTEYSQQAVRCTLHPRYFSGRVRGEILHIARIEWFHFYTARLEGDKTQLECLTQHYGLIMDYFTEIPPEQRKSRYTDIIGPYSNLSSYLNQRDARAERKLVPGLIKLPGPDRQMDRAHLEECFLSAMKMRRRVKEQLCKMGGFECWAVNFSYLDKRALQETFVNVLGEGQGGFITSGL